MTPSTPRHVLFRDVRLALDDVLDAVEGDDDYMHTEVQRQKIIALWESLFNSYYRAVAESGADEKPLPLWLLSQASTVQLERILRCVYHKHDVNNGEWRFDLENIPTTRGLDTKWNLYLFFGKQVMASRKALRHLQDAAKENPGLEFIDIFNQIELCRLQRLRGPAKTQEPLYTQADIQRGAKLASNLPLPSARSTPSMDRVRYEYGGGDLDESEEPDESDESDESNGSDGSHDSDGSYRSGGPGQPASARISGISNKTGSIGRLGGRESQSPIMLPVQSTKANSQTRRFAPSTRPSSTAASSRVSSRLQGIRTSPAPTTPVNSINLRGIASVSLNQRWPNNLQSSPNVPSALTRSRAKSAISEAEGSRRFVTPDQTPTLKRSAREPIGTAKRQRTFTPTGEQDCSVTDEPHINAAVSTNNVVARKRTPVDCRQAHDGNTDLSLYALAPVSEAFIDNSSPRDRRNESIASSRAGTSTNKTNVQNDSQPTPPNEQTAGADSLSASTAQTAPRHDETVLTSAIRQPEIDVVVDPSRDRAQLGDGKLLPYLMWGLAGASQRISEHQQLNDSAVNALVAMACRESRQNLGCVESHSLATFDVQAKRVRPYHRNLCSKDALLLVIHHEHHWALIYWDPRANVADYYDSLSSGSLTSAVESRAKYFVTSLSKWFTSVNLLPEPSSELVFNRKECYQQESSDAECGIHLVANAFRVAGLADLDQSDTSILRRLFACRILSSSATTPMDFIRLSVFNLNWPLRSVRNLGQWARTRNSQLSLLHSTYPATNPWNQLLLKEKRLEVEIESLCTKLEAYFHTYRVKMTAENTIQWQKEFYRGLESFQRVVPLIKLEAQWRQMESSPVTRDAGRVWLPDQVWDRKVDGAIQKIRELQQDLLPQMVWNSFVSEETGGTPFYMGGVSIVVVHATAQNIRKKMEDMTSVVSLMRTFQEGVEKLGIGIGGT